MFHYTIENNSYLKAVHEEGVSDAKEKTYKYGAYMFKYKIANNPYKNKTGSFGKKVKATWHNAFIGERGK